MGTQGASGAGSESELTHVLNPGGVNERGVRHYFFAYSGDKEETLLYTTIGDTFKTACLGWLEAERNLSGSQFVSFKDIATPYARMGIPVFPLLPKEKVPPASMGSWQDRATTDEAQVVAWDAENPDYNCGLVAKNDGFLILEFDIQGGMKAAALETGQEVPKTRVHISGKQRGHFIFRQTDRSREIGQVIALRPIGCRKAWRAIQLPPARTVTSSGQLSHPNGKPYVVAVGGDIDPIPVPDWIGDWVDRLRHNAVLRSAARIKPRSGRR